MTGSCRLWTATLAIAVCTLVLLAGVCGAYTQGDPEFRGFWVDAWHAGALNQSQVDTLLGVVGNGSSKGLIRAANFNGLQAVINAAHDTTGDTPSEIIVDEVDPQATFTGMWTSASGGYNSGYAWCNNRKSIASASYTWTPNVWRSGPYDVYCYYVSDPIDGKDPTTSAKYTVYYSGGTTSRTFNQTSRGGQWNLIASGLQFDAGTSGYVRLLNNTNETNTTTLVIADAIRWVYVGADTNPPTLSISAPSSTTTRSGPITYTISYADDIGVSAITLACANVTLNTTGTATGTVAVTGSGTASRTVTISGITGTGTLGISIAAGTATDAASNLAPAAGPSTTFAVDNTAPVINSVILTPAMAAVGEAIHAVVETTDNVGVTSVRAADETDLGPGPSMWAGDIHALGPFGVYNVMIVAKDAAGNTATNSSATYRSARIVGTQSRSAWQSVMESAFGIYLFKFWGRVAYIDDNYFTLSDGAGEPITVHAPGYKVKIVAGNYASARGILNIAGGARSIESALGFITKYE